MDIFIEDTNEVKVNFIYNQKDYIYKCQKNDKLIDLFNNFLNDIKKELNNLYLLYEGNLVEDYNMTISQFSKSDKEKEKIFLVYESNSINSVNISSTNSINDSNDEKIVKEINYEKDCALLIKNDDNKTEIGEVKKCCKEFIKILKDIYSYSGTNFYGENSTKSYFLKINIILFIQYCLILLVNEHGYHKNWNKIFTESENTNYITIGINSVIFTILCCCLFFMEKHPKYSCLLYFESVIFIPIINIYSFSITSENVKDYFLFSNRIINGVNAFSLISSFIFDFGTYRGVCTFLFFVILSAFAYTKENFFHLGDFIIYILYSLFCKHLAFKNKMHGFIFGVVISNYFMLMPLAIPMAVIALVFVIIMILIMLVKALS